MVLGCSQTIPDNVHDPGLLTLSQGHEEKQIQKSCVSFEEECITDKSTPLCMNAFDKENTFPLQFLHLYIMYMYIVRSGPLMVAGWAWEKEKKLMSGVPRESKKSMCRILQKKSPLLNPIKNLPPPPQLVCKVWIPY